MEPKHVKIAREIKDYLVENAITMTEVANRLGCSQQAVSNQLSGRKIGENVARKWADAFGFDLVYLMTGEGSLFQKDEPQHAAVSTDEPDTVPLLPIFAQAGHITGWSEGVEEAKCERVISPVKDIDMAVHVYGESMSPDIPNGAVCYVRRVTGRVIDYGRAYILDTVDGPVVKYLMPGSDEEHVRCLSANKEPRFAPYEVLKTDILGMYRVVMCMKMM